MPYDDVIAVGGLGAVLRWVLKEYLTFGSTPTIVPSFMLASYVHKFALKWEFLPSLVRGCKMKLCR